MKFKMTNGKKIFIINNKTNTCIIRESWHILSKHHTKKANVVKFDEKIAIKKNFS